MDMIRQEGREASAVHWARLWEERRHHALDGAYNDALLLRKKAREILGHPIATAVESADGQSVTIKPGKWTFTAAAVMAFKACEIQAAVLNAVGRDRPLEAMGEQELDATQEACEQYRARWVAEAADAANADMPADMGG